MNNNGRGWRSGGSQCWARNERPTGPVECHWFGAWLRAKREGVG